MRAELGGCPRDDPAAPVHSPRASMRGNLGESSPYSVTSVPLGKTDQISWPKQDFPCFDGDNPGEWISSSSFYFEMYQTPHDQKTIVAVTNFKGLANEWYRGYKQRHSHPDWDLLVQLVRKRFQETSALNAFDEMRQLYQTGTLKVYMQHFEKVKTRLEMESPYWPESEFLKAFISGLRDDIKPLVTVLKPSDYLAAFELAKHMECSIDNQWKVKISMLIGQKDSKEVDLLPEPVVATQPTMDASFATEEAVVSMFTLSNNPNLSTMRFKGKIGTTVICALLDSGSTHSFIDPAVLQGINCKFPYGCHVGKW